jgi:hypothetical protein
MSSFGEVGYRAAQKLAAHHSARNKNSFAASSIAAEFRYGTIPQALIKLQTGCGVDLSGLLLDDEDEDEQERAVAQFIGGCMRFAAEHPDD